MPCFYDWTNFLPQQLKGVRGRQTMAYGPNQADSRFWRLAFIGAQPCQFVYILSAAAYVLLWQS